jgi:hypothetical protein
MVPENSEAQASCVLAASGALLEPRQAEGCIERRIMRYIEDIRAAQKPVVHEDGNRERPA